jgi:hypothetical protein
MSAKLVKSKDDGQVQMRDLKDGQVAIITDSVYAGRIVQRYQNYCVAIGMPEGNSFSNVKVSTLTVRILENGELIEIYNNK